MISNPAPGPVSPSVLSAKISSCLLGGAVGDAVAHTRTAAAPGLSITADTQLALYSLDGLLEAIEWANEGVGADETACIWLAYLRWMRGSGHPLPDAGPSPLPRPIDSEPLLQQSGKNTAEADADVLAALSTGDMGTRQRPVNTGINTPAALVRSAPFGLLPYVATETVYKLALDAAALTHGHSSARHSAAVFASMVHGLLAPEATVRSAAGAALEQARENGVPDLALRLGKVLAGGSPVPGPEAGERTAEDSLALGLSAALTVEDSSKDAGTDIRAAAAAAIRRAAEAGGGAAAVVAGSLLGTRYGSLGLAGADLESLRERSVIEKIAAGFIASTIAP